MWLPVCRPLRERRTGRLKAGTTFTGYGIPDGVTLAQWIEDGCCVVNTANNKVVDASAITGTGTGTFAVRKTPAAITEPENKNGSIPYNGKIPADLFPKVTVNAGQPATQLTYEWYYGTGIENKLFITATPDGSGGYTQTPAADAFNSLKVNDHLNLRCVAVERVLFQRGSGDHRRQRPADSAHPEE